jgi:hypothetical protein
MLTHAQKLGRGVRPVCASKAFGIKRHLGAPLARTVAPKRITPLPCRAVARRAARISAVAEATPPSSDVVAPGDVRISISNEEDASYTVITVNADNRPGLLTSMTAAFRDLGLDVGKAAVDGEEGKVSDKFFVKTVGGSKILDSEERENIKKVLETILRTRSGVTVNKRPKFSSPQSDVAKRELLYTLMGKRNIGCTNCTRITTTLADASLS